MKISYLSNSLIPSRSANSVHVMKMCQALAANGHDVSLYAKRNRELDVDPHAFYGMEQSFKIHQVGFRNIRKLTYFIFAYETFKRLKREVPDLVIGRNVFSLFLARKFNRPIIYDAHEFPMKFHRRTLEKLLFKQRNFRRLVVISEGLKKLYLDAFKSLNPSTILVAHNAANEPDRSYVSNFEIQHGPDNSRLNIGYVGHLYPGRGIEVLVALAEQLPDVCFHIVGGYDKDVDIWKNKTQNFPNILYYGFIKNSDLQSFYPQMDILVAPYQAAIFCGNGQKDSSRWMSPMKLFEYMSYQKPIISSAVTTIHEILTHEQNALLCQPDVVSDWVDAINRLDQDRDLSMKIARQAYNDFQHKYTWTARAQLMIEG